MVESDNSYQSLLKAVSVSAKAIGLSNFEPELYIASLSIPSGESEKHMLLKIIASKFLRKEFGCNIVESETEFTSIDIQTVWGKPKRIIIDVTGEIESGLIGVECGELASRQGAFNKQGIFNGRDIFQSAELFDKDNHKKLLELYILPYGETIPFKSDIASSICLHCGHIVGYIR